MDNSDPIPITPPGTKTTDHFAVAYLWSLSPKSVRCAQKLLVATEKAVYGKGLFSTKQSRQQKVLAHLDALDQTLERDTGTKTYPYHAASRFLAQFARAYPNWQNEYRYLNEILKTRL